MNSKLNPQAGFSLVEVLVALLILSIGLLGLAGLQITGLQQNQGALQRTRAAQLANDLVDRIRVGGAAGYDLAPTDTYATLSLPVADVTVAQLDLIGWLADISTSLPAVDDGNANDVDVTVSVVNGLVTVTIPWTGDRQGTIDTLTVVSQL
jgi:type IV pilus assembly protein PilV